MAFLAIQCSSGRSRPSRQLGASWMVCSRNISDCLAHSCQLCGRLTALRPPYCSGPFWLLDTLLGYSTFSWSPLLSWMLRALLDPQCTLAHSAYSSLPGVLVVTLPALAALCHPGYAAPFWGFSAPSLCHSVPAVAITITSRPPGCSAAPSDWHEVGTHLIVWHSPG